MVNGPQQLIFRFGDFELREREHRLLRAGEDIHLQPRAFRLLVYLVHNRNRVVEKDEIIQDVWDGAAVTDNSLARSISGLRKVLEDDAREAQAIRTVSSIGYRFICPVEQVEASEPTSPAVEDAGTPLPLPDPAHYPKRRRWALPAAAAVFIALLAGGSWYLLRSLAQPRITAYTQITHDGHDKYLAATDGSRLYFTQNSPNFIEQIGVAGGQVAQLPLTIRGQQLMLWDVSADGSDALIGTQAEGNSDNDLWIAPVLGGPARHLANGGGGEFSPDGSSVIYSTLNGDIFLISTDGTGNHRLGSVDPVAFGASASWFRWSPDRKTIRFSTGYVSRFMEMSADGSGLHPILADWKGGTPPCCGVWTRDGHFFLFVADDQIWALDERRGLFRRPSTVPIQLTSGPIHWAPPVLGRDGKTIFAGGVAPKGELSRIDLKTGAPQPFLGGISAEEASFSPDGKFVAYVSYPDGTLWKADRDGANRVQIAPGPEYHVNPEWSPDSKELVFGTITPDAHFSIHRVSAADGMPLWLIPEESGDTHDPNWSRDGTKVLFCLGPPAGATTARQDLRIVDLKSRQVKTLPGSEGRWSPRWSPDGRYIAAMAGGTNPGGLLVFDLKTELWRTLPVTGDVSFPAFSSDSRFICFLRYGHDQGVFRIPVAGGKAERLADLADWHLTGYYGYSMSLDPSGAPLVLRDMSRNDIYALTLETR